MSDYALVRFGITCRLSKEGVADAIKSTPAFKVTPGQESFTRYYPWGFDSRMPLNGSAVLVSLQGGSNLSQVGGRHQSYQPDYADEEWTQILHNEVTGTWVKLRKDGGVQIKGNGAGLIEIKPSGSIELNGNDVAVIKSGDGVTPTGDMLDWMNAIGGALAIPVPPTVSAKIGTSQSNSTKVVTGV